MALLFLHKTHYNPSFLKSEPNATFAIWHMSFQTSPNPAIVLKMSAGTSNQKLKAQFCYWPQCNNRQSSGRRYLSVLQRVDLWVEGRADHFIVPGVGRRSSLWVDVESCQALCVCDGIVLPGFKGHAIAWPLQDPVTCACEVEEKKRKEKKEKKNEAFWIHDVVWAKRSIKIMTHTQSLLRSSCLKYIENWQNGQFCIIPHRYSTTHHWSSAKWRESS